MSTSSPPDVYVGTGGHDLLNGPGTPGFFLGLAGDDTINAGNDADTIYGDFIGENLLEDTGSAISFAQYGASGSWTVSQDENGNSQMSQTVNTLAGGNYEIAFEVAANHAGGMVSGRVEVLWNEEVIGTIDTSSAVFSEAVLNFTGTGEPGDLTFRALPSAADDGPEINTDGPVFWYEKSVELQGETVQVKAFAEGQANIYQVLNGELNVFDPVTETYTPAGAEATVVVNSIGFNQEDDLIYGIAVRNGVDALGNAVSQSDLVMYDAEGKVYLVGESPYRSWTGDFDDKGNLWSFQSSIDRITKIDVDKRDADGNPETTTFKFPYKLETDQIWDVAYDAASQSFFGIVRPGSEGEATHLVQIDISAVEDGGEPVMTDIPVTSTLIDGVMQDGVPSMTYGALVIDGDGNFYAGGNGGDHDMDDATGTSGGIYQIIGRPDGTAYLELVSDAPKSYSNDGAVDPRAMDPFTEFDPSAMVLIREPALYEVEDPEQSYDDDIHAGAGRDEVHSGYGDDEVIGSSHGDNIHGGDGADSLYGGAGPGYVTDKISYYDEDGLRYDQFGNLLPEDDDVIFGGLGSDFLHGSAGHDMLSGGEGNDTLDGGTGHDLLYGDSGDDQLHGGREDDVLDGGTGDDLLEGSSGYDTLSGGDGQDTLKGGRDDDVLFGGDGDDRLVGGSHDDTLDGGDGEDRLIGGTGEDYLIGGDGDDNLNGGKHDDKLEGGVGDDELLGGSGNDELFGDEGADFLEGGAGEDVLRGGSGNDQLKGGQQNDVLYGGDGRDRINGGSHNDLLAGEDGDDYLNGYHGDDTLDGGEGDDKLVGGKGMDLLTGGAGSDVFVFEKTDLDGTENTITDFANNALQSDVLDLRDLDVLADGQTASDWLDANMVQTLNGDLFLDLSEGSIRFEARDDGSSDQAALFNDILDGLWV